VSSTKLTFNPSTGGLSATNFNSTSDIQLKENISYLSNSIDKLEKISPIRFTWKDNGNVSYGVIAQELENIIPELVKTNGNNKTVNYSGLIPFLINAIVEDHNYIKVLENRINDLENK